MASKEEGSQPLNYKTCVLKVSIHCEGCKKKVKKILKNINGVHSVDIDALQNKVTVAGDVDTETLIRRLAKSGKNADTWPEKKPANPNPSPKPNANPKEKNKEKESEPAAKEVVATAADKTPTATSSEPATKPAAKPAETATKPVETAAKPTETTAEPAKKEAAESSSKEAAKPGKEPEKEPADTKSGTDTKPAETSAKPGGSGKKKGKIQEEPPRQPSPLVAAAWEGHSGNSPRDRALPVYQVPVYAVSHNTAAPMASHSYYYAPTQTPAMPQSYAGHSAYNYSQPQPPPQQPEYYPSGSYSYNGSDNYYGSSPHSYSYYGSSSTELRASPSRSYPSHGQGQGGLDMFNDENANSCSVM